MIATTSASPNGWPQAGPTQSKRFVPVRRLGHRRHAKHAGLARGLALLILAVATTGCADDARRADDGRPGGGHGEVDTDYVQCGGSADLSWSSGIPEGTTIRVMDGMNSTVLTLDHHRKRGSDTIIGEPGVWSLHVLDGEQGDGAHSPAPSPSERPPVLKGTGGVGGDEFWVTIVC